MTYVSNHEQAIRTDVAEFMITQRNVGFADNDGQWIVTQLAEFEYNHLGTLYKIRGGKFLGAFADLDAARAAIATATVQPECRIPLN
jgi:hypothetical protein